MATSLCRTPDLSIDCSSKNKRSLGDQSDFIYQTPPPSWNNKKQCTTNDYFSPPPPPRGKHSASYHIFVFDDEAVADLMLPDLGLAKENQQQQQSESSMIAPVRLQYRRHAASPDIVLPSSSRRSSKRRTASRRLPLTPVQEEDDNDSALMPPPATPHKNPRPQGPWGRPQLPEKPTRAGTEYARCA